MKSKETYLTKSLLSLYSPCRIMFLYSIGLIYPSRENQYHLLLYSTFFVPLKVSSIQTSTAYFFSSANLVVNSLTYVYIEILVIPFKLLI
jgi:hypothetical protein